jgi:hypothetical protein
MATDKHYNEPGVMPEPLEDPKGTDMPATRNMFLIIAALAIFAVAVVVVLQMSS